MNAHNRSRAFAVALAGLLAMAAPMGWAQAIICTNCATEITQLLNNIQLVDQLARQIQLVQQAFQQTANLELNTQELGKQSWGNTIAEIKKLNDLLAQAKSLSIVSSNLDASFAEKYKDFNSYVSGQIGEEAVTKKYQQWSEDTNSSVLTALKAAQLSNSQIEADEDNQLRQLEGLADTAEGRMQAIQVGSQIAMAGVRQTQKLRQIMLLQVQLVGDHIKRQNDRETVEAARWENFSKPVKLPADDKTR